MASTTPTGSTGSTGRADVTDPRGLHAVVARYAAAWNEPDDDARRALLEAAWADGGRYCDPTARVEGRDALHAHIRGFQQQFGGARIEATSGADEHDGYFRFSWALVDADGNRAMDGFDVGHRDRDGRIDLIIGFFGPFPPLDR
jgi:hypothetical protein